MIRKLYDGDVFTVTYTVTLTDDTDGMSTTTEIPVVRARAEEIEEIAEETIEKIIIGEAAFGPSDRGYKLTVRKNDRDDTLTWFCRARSMCHAREKAQSELRGEGEVLHVERIC